MLRRMGAIRDLAERAWSGQAVETFVHRSPTSVLASEVNESTIRDTNRPYSPRVRRSARLPSARTRRV